MEINLDRPSKRHNCCTCESFESVRDMYLDDMEPNDVGPCHNDDSGVKSTCYDNICIHYSPYMKDGVELYWPNTFVPDTYAQYEIEQ